ncbi:MAG: hypothetical protein NC930_05610 [Candidatus Omnitrophica bacterium]|nr:hypothetical protein [Candidatus Omnitrophota bacterium]
MGEKPKKLIGELLIEDGVLTRDNLLEALDHQKKNGGLIGQILISHGYITEENLVAALGRQLDIPYLPLQNYNINPENAALLDEEFCRRNFLTLFDADDRNAYVAMSDPLNQTALRELESCLRRRVHVFISTSTEIVNILDTLYSTQRKKH